MSISGALNSAVSALNSQSSALAMIATNLANSSTVGYKTVSASFSTLLSGDGSKSASGSSGGVKVASLTNVGAQGLPMTSSVSTNMAISGSGFFVVASGPEANDLKYTRNGEFAPDEQGYLVNNGQYLQGWPTDPSGNVVGGANSGSLEAIDVDKFSTIAGATTKVGMVANLPADAAICTQYTSSLEIFDSLGTAATTTVTWEKTAQNAWTATFSDPVSSTSGLPVGTVPATPIAITFDGTGNLLTPAAAPSLAVTWTTGATASTIALNMGEAGTKTGLSQLTTGTTTAKVDLQTTQDGVAFGALSQISIGENGTVMANYNNGMSQAIYKVSVATFANPNGLTGSSGGLYSQNAESGTSTLRIAGENGAGNVLGSTLEMSTTDTNKEFASMMAAQQAYSGSAQVMSSANKMFDTLIGAVR